MEGSEWRIELKSIYNLYVRECFVCFGFQTAAGSTLPKYKWIFDFQRALVCVRFGEALTSTSSTTPIPTMAVLSSSLPVTHTHLPPLLSSCHSSGCRAKLGRVRVASWMDDNLTAGTGIDRGRVKLLCSSSSSFQAEIVFLLLPTN